MNIRHNRRAERFPYFFVGTFIEAPKRPRWDVPAVKISLLFRRDFH